MNKLIVCVMVLAVGAFLTVGSGCSTSGGGGGGGGGGGDDDLCADVECPDGQECNPATGQCEPVDDDGDAVDGAAVYAESCAACHGADGSGGAVNITGMTAAQLSAGLESASHDAISLSEEEIAAIADFLSDGGGQDGDDGNGAELNVVNSGIPIRGGYLAVGDDIVVYGATNADGTPNGVDYMVPSAGDTAGRGIPGGPDFKYNHFAVSGKKIALVGGPMGTGVDFQVSIYDTATATMTAVDLEQLELGNTSDIGKIRADGNYVVARCGTSPVVRVIDVSGDAPVVVPFTVDPGGATSGFGVSQVLVDADTMTVVSVSTQNDVFYVYDIENPGAAPVEFAGPTEGIGDGFTFAMDKGVILFADNAGYNDMFLLDVTNPANVPVPLEPGEGEVATVHGDHYGYLSTEGPSGYSGSAVGLVADASPAVAEDEMNILEGSANWGEYGQGGSIAIGELNGDVIWIIIGPLQWSTTGGTGAGAWNVIYEPPALEVPLFGQTVETNEAGSLLGFAWSGLGSDETTLGYAILGN